MNKIITTLTSIAAIATSNAQTTINYDLGSSAGGFGDGAGSSTDNNSFTGGPSTGTAGVTAVSLCYTIKFNGMVGADNHCSPVGEGGIKEDVWTNFYPDLSTATGITDETLLHDAWTYDSEYGVIKATTGGGKIIYYNVNTESWLDFTDPRGDILLTPLEEGKCPDLNWNGEVGVSIYVNGGDQIDASTNWSLGPVAPGEWVMGSYTGGATGEVEIDSSAWANYLDGSVDLNSSILFSSAADVPQTSGALWGDSFDNGDSDFTYTVEVVMKVTTVPEPSSTALLGLGFLGLIVRRKR